MKINLSIYDLLKKNNILNDIYINNLIKIEYIINNGKIIFKFVHNEGNNILIYKKSDNYIFIPEIILYFHSNKNEMDEQYEKFKINKNIKYDINNIGNNNNFIQVDSFYLYDTQNKVEVSKITTDNQINKKSIEFLLNIYLTHKDIEKKTKRNLINTNIEEYSIIKKDSMNKILIYFEYNNFIAFIEENIIDKNEDKILDEIMNKYYNNEYLMNLNNKVKKASQALRNIENINENKTIDYNDDIEIINNKVKNYINELFGDIYIINRKFLFGDQKIIMDYKFTKNYFIIGKFENCTFKPEIMLNFEQKKNTVDFFSIFKNKGYNDFINELKLNNNLIITSDDKRIKEIKINENYQFSSIANNNEGSDVSQFNLNKDLYSLNNNKSNQNIINNEEKDNSGKVINEIQSSNINNESNKNKNEFMDDDRESHQQLFSENTNSLNPQNNRLNTDIETDILNKADKKEANDGTLINQAQETDREFSDNIKKIKLSSFTENQIKALILYYFFYLRLENDVKNSNIDIKNSECYLINKNWMNKFKEFYLYEKLVKNIKNIIQNLNVDIYSENIDKIIYVLLDEEYLKEVNEKEDNYSYYFEDKNKISNFIGKINDEEMGAIIYYYGFDILSVDVYNLIVERKNSSFDLIKKDCLINDGKIIIKFEEEYKIKLLVGHFDFIKYQYFSENLLYYHLDKKLNDFEYLKICHYNKFIKENIYKNKYLIIITSQKYLKIGKIIELNNQNNEILEVNENKIDDDEISSQDLTQNIINLQSKNNIEFLLRLYFYYKSFKERFNNPITNKQNQETGYIINKDLIEKYKEYYNYNELKKFCDSKTIEVKSLEEFENSFEDLSRILPNTYIEEINKKDNNSSLNAILSNHQIINQNLNPDNCVVLDEKLINLLYNSNESIKRNKNKIKIKYTIYDKKLIIFYNNNIYIGTIDDNCVFKLENKIPKNSNEELNQNINEIKKNEFDNFKDNFNREFSGNKNIGKSLENKINIRVFLTKNNVVSNIKNDKNISNEKNKSATPSINIMNSDFYFMNSNIERMNKILKNILSIIIDSEKIKYKMKMPLNSGNLDEYFLLNNDWFKKYLELNNVHDEIYEHLVNSVKKNNNICNISNNKIKNEMLINNIISQITPNIKIKIKKDKENYYKLKENELCNISSSEFITKGYIKLKYYYNFILISPETIDSLKKDFPFYYDPNLILFGDNKAFIKRKKQSLIEICFMNNKNILIPELFFYFYNDNILNNNLYLLQINGYEQYSKCNLLFNNDVTSPIFDKNNDNIGYSFKYDPSIKDYSIYQINDQLKAMIKLYFSHAQLKNKLKSNELLFGKYLIYDIKYIQKIKEFFEYNYLEKELSNNIIAKQVMNSLGKNNNKNDNNNLNDKRISLIIKNLPENLNTNYNKKQFNNKIIKCQEIPNLIPINNSNLFYYNNFEIVDILFNDLLFGQKNNLSQNEEKENYLECIFIEKYILINVSNTNNEYILEVCIINDNNNIIPLYLLEYDNKNNFIKHFKYVKSLFGVKNFFESLDFTSNSKIQLNDENEQKISIIHKLGINNNINNNMDKIIDNNNGPNIINKGQKKFPSCDSFRIISQNIPQISYNKSNDKIKESNNPYNDNTRINANNIIIKSITDIFLFPSKIGLQNVGSTSYMNATLQCFCNILHFVDFFKFNPKVEETINKYEEEDKLCLTSSFKIIIDNLWPYGNKILKNYCGKNTNNAYFIPKEFKNKISRMNELFKGEAAYDSKDLVNFIIMTLQEELNEPPKNISNKFINNHKNQSNNFEVLQYFLENFKKENSIISKEFYAVNHTFIKCSKCLNIKYDYQSYFFIIFPLEEIRKYKIDDCSKQLMNIYQNGINADPSLFQNYLEKMKNFNSLSLEDCFNYYETINYLQGENSIYCDTCKIILPFFYQTKLFTVPEILIIILDRGKAIESKIEFDLLIDITKYIELKENNGWKYELIGVVSKLEENNASGQFIAYCKSPIGNGWYQYNDELVFEVKDFKEIRDYSMPYILFYQKLNKQ